MPIPINPKPEDVDKATDKEIREWYREITKATLARYFGSQATWKYRKIVEIRKHLKDMFAIDVMWENAE